MASYIFREVEPLTITTDGSGNGNVTTAEPLNGGLWAVDVDFGTADATVLTCAIVGGAADGINRTVFQTASTNTDGLYVPRRATIKAVDGTAGIGEEIIPICGRNLIFAVTSAGASKTITIKVILVN